jgi:uncharacterized protein YdeI (YjbR/CyaY-like superfamily)
MSINDTETFYPETKQQWREWLAENHSKKNSVWVIFYKKSAKKPSITWSEAVDEALCFGWIDSVKRKLDEERSIQFFSKRKPKSTWSRINKDKVETLSGAGLIAEAGWACIEMAKQNGSWEILDSVEDLVVPQDLEIELNARSDAMPFFMSLSKSAKKAMLQWLVMAKRPETRQKRITEIAECASQKKKPKQF